MKVTYIHHSAFCVEIEGSVLVFDYYNGKGVPFCRYHGKMPEYPEGTPVYVFSSHSHRDHFGFDTLSWMEKYHNIYYIFAKEIKKKLGNSALKRMGIDERVKERITYVKPGEQWDIGDAHVETLRSTDSGVAFLVTIFGKTIYHAGDLNWWKWKEETAEFNVFQEKTYKEQIDLLKDKKIDLAFVVLDPRQEEDMYLGIDYFMENAQADHILPMHVWKRYELIREYREHLKNEADRKRILMVERENQELVIT